MELTWQQIMDTADSLGLRQWQLAHKLNVSVTWLSHVRHGRRNDPTLKVRAEKIVRAEAKARQKELAKL